ncbi:MAG: sigma-54-dependent Fis family transcriptional regulator [Planctomycetota bacterium]|nr:MAG: sigma-54-dependent Fis family transcriptional regulator [Planctomycetota bacterium]
MSKTDVDNTKQVTLSRQTANVLIADSDPQFARVILEILARKGIRGIVAKDKKTAVDLLDKDSYDLVFTSNPIIPRPGLSPNSQVSLELIRKIKADSPELPIVMTANAESPDVQNHQPTIDAAVSAVRAGCCDFLIKPSEARKIEALFDEFLPTHSVSTLDSAEQDTRTLYRIVGKSAKLSQTVELAKRIAPTSAPVLISGESGTGKELVSFLIHHNSKRAQGPYVKVNCAALSDSLLESELFGHEKGAFTGAYTQRKGRFEMAHGGTLLLDEITETPPRFQAKLLRTLEQQDFERVGGNENVRVNIRVISTTNRDLLEEVSHGRFRRDLYYRISAVRLVIPPLRQRAEDLPDLVWHFVNLHARETQRTITELDPTMMDLFEKYHWPGNVRQLRNVVLTSLVLGLGQTLSLADVSWLFDELQPLPQEKPSDFVKQSKSADHTRVTASGLGGVPLEQIERQAILDTLNQTAGNQTKAAKVLGISDRTLRDKIRRYRQQGCLQSVS